MNYIVARLKEKSTFLGLGMLSGTAANLLPYAIDFLQTGVANKNILSSILTIAAGVVCVLVKEKRGAE